MHHLHVTILWVGITWGGEKSDIADRIGEKVDMMWQMWKDSLWYNNYLENITSKEVTYYEYSA